MSEKIVQLNEEIIKGQIKELVRGSVEETLNELLEKEAESLTQAARYERSEARQGLSLIHIYAALLLVQEWPLALSADGGRKLSRIPARRHGEGQEVLLCTAVSYTHL